MYHITFGKGTLNTLAEFQDLENIKWNTPKQIW